MRRRSATRLDAHVEALSACTRCPQMHGPVIIGERALGEVMLVGQAPGPHEGRIGRPFGWTAGKTLFAWLAGIGVDEDAFRARTYIASVCRCFPGKAKGGGDRVPSREEIAACRPWMDAEFALLRPKLVLAVGKLAIAQFLPSRRLVEQIGQSFACERAGHRFDLIPLPHPSGASTWHRTEPGKTLLTDALALIAAHPAWRATHGTSNKE